MSASLLKGVVVLEVAGERGAAAAQFLGSLGAEVNKVGRGADAAYDIGKFHDPDAAADEIAVAISAADIVISDDPKLFRSGGPFAGSAFVDGRRLVAVSLTPFGVAGEMADWLGPEIVVSAMGGALGVTGYEDRPPVKEAGEACGFHAEMMAAAGALMAWFDLGEAEGGRHVDISVSEVAASRMTNGVLAWQCDHRLLERTGVALSYGKARVRCVWDLADGHVFHSLMTGRFGAPANAALSAWMDEAGFDNPMKGVDWLTYDRSALPSDTRVVWESAIDAFFRSRTRAEMREEGRRRGINACVVNAPGDVLDDSHLAARGFLAGEPKLPSRFVRVVDAPKPVAMKPTARSVGSKRGALEGVRVLDFSWALVGSITTKLLADHGAEVIKVESRTRPCLSRIDVQVAASKRGSFDDKPWFIHMNTSKKSLALNMKRPESREVVDPLVEWADVVVENFSPGTMKSLGLDYETLSARRPDIVMVSGSVFGQTGPLAKEWGVDGTGAALSGRLALTGWADRTPVTPSAVPYGDVLLPPMMAGAAVAALIHRRATGQGCHIDASMYEACVQQMAPAILAAQAGGDVSRHGNDDPLCVLQGVWPTSEGRFVAIRVEDEAAWLRLGRLVGGDWSQSAAMLAPARRMATIAHLRFWLEQHGPWEAMRELQSAGVAAGVVQTAADLVDHDRQLRERGFLVKLDNPALGAFEHQASPIHISGRPGTIRTAPGMGEHSDEICSDIAGLSAKRIAELRSLGVFE
jgi:crotonobetainyl-CoA:carnitine CoA-transferase CaiB-like acyl-CoA transferase